MIFNLSRAYLSILGATSGPSRLPITCELILLFQPLLQCMLLLIPAVFATRTVPTITCVWFVFMVCFILSMYQHTALYQLYISYTRTGMWLRYAGCTLVNRWSQCMKHSSSLVCFWDTLSTWLLFYFIGYSNNWEVWQKRVVVHREDCTVYHAQAICRSSSSWNSEQSSSYDTIAFNAVSNRSSSLCPCACCSSTSDSIHQMLSNRLWICLMIDRIRDFSMAHKRQSYIDRCSGQLHYQLTRIFLVSNRAL